MSQGKHEIYFTIDDYKKLKRSYQFQLLKQFTQTQLLLIAKAYFIDQQYSQCIEILDSKISGSSNAKIVFQKYSLLFRATYLKNNEDDAKLLAILKKYQQQKNKHADYKFKKYHNNVFKQFQHFVTTNLKSHIEKQNQVVDEHSKIQTSKKQDIKSIQNQFKKQKTFAGFPCYIIDPKWRKIQQKFTEDNYQAHPGPITNFSLVNHIYQIIPYEDKSKAYLNTILFPSSDNYQAVNRRHWEFLLKLYSGIGIKRIQIKSEQFTNDSDCNDQTVTKIHIIGNGRSNIIQVNVSSQWSQVSKILQKSINLGQLKKRVSSNYFKLVDSNMRVGHPKEPVKHVTISQHSIHTNFAQQDLVYRNQIFCKYDFETYQMINFASGGLIGIQNPKFFCYMIASIQCLSNTPKMTATFLQNEHLQNINYSSKNINGSRGQVACAYADLIKKIWTYDKSEKEQNQIDLTLFKQTFGKRFDIFSQDTQQDAHQFLNFFLNCLHDDLNVKKNESNTSNSLFQDTTGFQKIRDAYVSFSQKSNQSIVSKLFKSYTYSSLMCKQCNTVYYNFDVHLTITLPLPAANPVIGLRYISHNSLEEQIQIFKIFVGQIKFIKDLVDLVRKHKKITQEFEYHVFKIKRLTFVFQQEISMDAQIQSIFPSLTQNYFVLYQINKDLQQKGSSSVKINIQNSNKQVKMAKCLMEFQYNHQRKGIPRLISINVNSSYEQRVQIASQYISDTAVSKIGSGILTDKQKQQLIESAKLQKVKNKSFDYVLKIVIKSKISISKEGQIVQLGQECADQNFDIQTCFKIYNQKQNITIDENWNCEKCRKICQAEKQENIFQIGNNMIIILKRFRQDQKIYTKIDYPIKNLDMSRYISQKAKSLITEKFVYDLYGVIVHRGNLNRGHYTAYCKHYGTKKWHLFDDQDVRQVQDQQEIINQNAYILFYQRRK